MRRQHLRVATETEIRRRARALLIDEGPEAVTLRAIAREVGVTAPALYRYYDSREALLLGVCDDICADLTEELSAAKGSDSGDHVGRVLGVCRAFRAWALAHPAEFGLVFATAREDVSMSRAFLTVAAEWLAVDVGGAPCPPELIDDLTETRRSMVAALASTGVVLDEAAIGLEAVHWILQWWIRIYGHVALEVFGRFPFEVAGAEKLFDLMLADLARDSGLTEAGV